MKKAKLMLAAIAVLAIAGGVYAAKAKADLKLFYSYTTAGGVSVCATKVSVTTTAGTLGTVSVPIAGAIGWFTTDECTGNITRATTIAN
jgi:hypothetical protein